MLHIKKLGDAVELFKALGSELRIQIVNLLLEHGEMNMNEIASKLGITAGALTSHIRKLEESGIIKVSSEHGSHGNQKLCSVEVDKILIDVMSGDNAADPKSYTVEIPIGHYNNYAVSPTCGLSTTKHLIGEVDDPRYFAHPDHVKAGILWLTKGFVEYRIPNMIPAGQKLDRLMLSFEISSEAPGVNDNWPSDIQFYLNDRCIGKWTSPGDFGDVHGVFTPDWWYPHWNQYGLLKMLVVNQSGTFIDGLRISEVTAADLNLCHQGELKLRFAVDEQSGHVGGLTLFGQGFGNYNQEISAQIHYTSV
ncbi:MAG: winged helix-turn-helix transcriptional regulator [Clostridiales bacterium]|nr:winged helix-turn-helix transcriptional regulator [Clostridiales bacterium]